MMDRETLARLRWLSSKMDFAPNLRQTRQLVDSNIDALDKIDKLTRDNLTLTGLVDQMIAEKEILLAEIAKVKK